MLDVVSIHIVLVRAAREAAPILIADKERAEMNLLKTYLPAEMSEEELEAGLREIIASTGAQSKKDMGKVMKEATARYKGRVDGKKIQEIVSRLLP